MDRSMRIPHWGWWVAIIGGMGLTAWIGFSSSGFALWQQWVTTSMPQALFQWIFWLALLAHVGEAAYAIQLARSQKRRDLLLWGLQTFILGYPSLRLLKEAA